MNNIEVYQVDSAVPLPDGKQPLPLRQLNIGESFVFPIERRASISSMATIFGKKTDRKFTIRKEGDNLCRIWRSA